MDMDDNPKATTTVKTEKCVKIETLTDSNVLTTTQLNFEEFIAMNSDEMIDSSAEKLQSDNGAIKTNYSSNQNNSRSDIPTTSTEKTISTTSANNEVANSNKSQGITTEKKKLISVLPVKSEQFKPVIKFSPKALSGTIAKNSSGQYILIQPNGQVQPIRLSGPNTSGNSNNNTASIGVKKTNSTEKEPPVAIKVMRTSDGNLIHLKTGTKTLNLGSLNLGGKKVMIKTSGGNSKILPQASTATSTASKILSSNTSTATAVSTTTPQKILNSSVPPPKILNSTLPTLPKILNSSLPTMAATTGPKILNSSLIKPTTISPSTNLILKREVDGSPKTVSSTQTLLKIKQIPKVGSSSTSAGGNGNLKYVRILNPGVASSSNLDSTKSSANVVYKQATDGSLYVVSNASSQQQNSANNVSKSDSNTYTKIQNKIILPKPAPKILNNLISGPQRIVASGSGGFLLNKNNIRHHELKLIPNQDMKLLPMVGSIEIKKNVIRQNVNSLLKPLNDRPVIKTEKADDIPFKIIEDIRPLSPPTETISEAGTDSALRRKHCNCTKSQCLKLYCDCFANGEFCQDCNCKECFNNLEYEDERQRAIKMCLDRNPAAFKPKITKAKDQTDLRLHNKGCNCKRSGCLKNYCECYEAKIACSSNCKCVGCRNIEDRRDLTLLDVAERIATKNFTRPGFKRPAGDELEKPITGTSQRTEESLGFENKPYNFITQDVIDATIQCMIAQADECQKSGLPIKVAERMILEELGRCLVEIIDFSIRNIDN